MSEEILSDADYQALLESSDQDADTQLNHSPHLRVMVGGEPGIEGEQKLTMATTAAEGEKMDFNDGKYKTSTLFRVTAYIIVMEFCERLAYYGFAGSLVLLFESQLGLTNEEADTQYAMWSGVCYVMPLFGGWLADSYLGRYHSILLFSLLYLVGLFAAASSCVPGHVSPFLLFPAMYLLALGTGGIKANVSVFGADQFDDSNPRDTREKLSFFNWFYWSINLGALISYTLVSYVCQYGLPFLGGPDWGFMVGYFIPCIAMILALVVFLAGTPRYRRFPPSGSVLSRAAGLVAEAAFSRREVVQSGGVVGGGSGDAEENGGEGRPKWLQRASERWGGSYPHDEVAAVSRVWRLLPFLALQVPYWAVYAQMSTAFQNQGCQMDLSVFGFDIPVAALNTLDVLAILCLIPLFDRGVYPWMRRRGYEPSKLRKIGAGMILAGSAVLVAAWVEVARRRGVEDGEGAVFSPCQRERDYNPEEFQNFWRDRDTTDAPRRPAYCHQVPGCDEIGLDGLLLLECIYCEMRPLSSSVSVLWQIPQYLLIGASEILSSVTSMEFFYDEAPTTMRGVSAGLNLLTTALGSWITIPLLRLVNSGAFGAPWMPHDLNKGRMDLYFCILAGLVGGSFALFVKVARGYRFHSASSASAGYSSMDEAGGIEGGDNPRGAAGSDHAEERGRDYARVDRDGSEQASDEDRKLLPKGNVGGTDGQGSPTFGQI